jgi:hypothetical protein
MLFVVVQCLPESDPDVQQAQPAADTAEEPVCNNRTQGRKREQQVVVSPLRRPRKNDQQNPRHRADQYKQKDRDAVHPELNAAWRCGLFMVQNCSLQLRTLGSGRRHLAWQRCGLRHSCEPQAFSCPKHEPPSLVLRVPPDCPKQMKLGSPTSGRFWQKWEFSTNRSRSVSPLLRDTGMVILGTKPIRVFYDFSALMRSATSR